MTKKSKSASSEAAGEDLGRPQDAQPPLAGAPKVYEHGGLVFIAVIVGLMLLVIAIDLLRR